MVSLLWFVQQKLRLTVRLEPWSIVTLTEHITTAPLFLWSRKTCKKNLDTRPSNIKLNLYFQSLIYHLMPAWISLSAFCQQYIISIREKWSINQFLVYFAISRDSVKSFINRSSSSKHNNFTIEIARKGCGRRSAVIVIFENYTYWRHWDYY